MVPYMFAFGLKHLYNGCFIKKLQWRKYSHSRLVSYLRRNDSSKISE